MKLLKNPRGVRAIHRLLLALDGNRDLAPTWAPPDPSRPWAYPRPLVGERVPGLYPSDLFGRVVSLTFDDGPHPRRTPQVLRHLARAGVKATFFVVGKNVKYYPWVTRAIVRGGHEIGHHSWDHANFAKLDNRRLAGQIDQTQAALDNALRYPRVYKKAGGGHGAVKHHAVVTMRLPYGSPTLGRYRGTTRERVAAVLRARRLFNVLWSADSSDWVVEMREDPNLAIEKVMVEINRRGGAILLHDIHPSSVKLLPLLLAELKRRRYRVVPLSTLLAMKYARSRVLSPVDAPYLLMGLGVHLPTVLPFLAVP